MTVNTNNAVLVSGLSGFGQYTPSVSFSASVISQHILTGAYIGPIRATTSLNNTNAVSEIQIQFSGLESFVRELPGIIIANYPNWASPNYQIECFSYFSGGILKDIKIVF